MNELKKSIHDNANGLDYTLVNDHYLPNLTVAAPAEHPTGRWGRLHKRYLKEHHPIRYNQLLLSGELGSYLAKLDKQSEEQLALTVRQMQEAEGVTETLKAADQLEWVCRMNSIRNRAEEIIKSELIFVQGGAHDGCAEMDAETCLSPAASAADSGTVGGHLPHDLLHDPDESAGGTVLLRGSGKLGHEAGKRQRSPENADYRICGFRPALHSDSCYRQNLLFR